MSPACADLFCMGELPRRAANESCLDSKGAVVSCNLMVEHLAALACIQSTLVLHWLLNSGEHCAGRHKSLERAWYPRSGLICLRADFSLSDRLFSGDEKRDASTSPITRMGAWFTSLNCSPTFPWAPSLLAEGTWGESEFSVWERAICHYPIMCNERVLFACCPAPLDCYQPECTISVLISNGILSSWGALIRDETGIFECWQSGFVPWCWFLGGDEAVSGAVCVCERAV